MQCPYCGAPCSANMQFCSACGAPIDAPTVANPYQPSLSQTAPSDYLAWSIITAFLCLPLGIVAIIYSTKVSGAVARGDLAAAQKASSAAKTWNIVGAVGFALYILLMIIVAAAGA